MIKRVQFPRKPIFGSFAVIALCAAVVPGASRADSLQFVANSAGNYEYALLGAIPSGFGSGEFTLEMWVRPTTAGVSIFTDGSPGQLSDWYGGDPAPYSSSSWWFRGNFLLDGHNNNSFADGTFSVQFYGGGRVRWLFGDGTNAGAGEVRAIEATPATSVSSLLDGAWHRIDLVRAWSGTTSASLELWIDGDMIDSQTSPVRTNMRTYWDTWTGFPTNQSGWFFGSEKQAAIGVLSQYEDYKGLLDNMRFYSRALTDQELQDGTASQTGLAALYSFSEGTGSSSCDNAGTAPCFQLKNFTMSAWNNADAPASGGGGGGGGGGNGGFDFFGGTTNCFIATAAYGTPLDKDLDLLRGFRDARLLTNAGGAAFVDGYYRVSPAIAGFVATHEFAARPIREALIVVVAILKLDSMPLGKLVFALAVLVFTIGAVRRRDPARGRARRF